MYINILFQLSAARWFLSRYLIRVIPFMGMSMILYAGTGINVCENGGFEIGGSSGAEYAAFWNHAFVQEAKRSSDAAYSGQYSIKISSDNNWGWQFVSQIYNQDVVGKWASFSAYVMTPSGDPLTNGYFILKLTFAGTNIYKEMYINGNDLTQNVWKQFMIECQVPENTAYIEMSVTKMNEYGTIYIDDCRLEICDNMNPSFELGTGIIAWWWDGCSDAGQWSIGRSTEQSHSYDYSLKITGTNGAWLNATQLITPKAFIGAKVVFSAWLYTPSTDPLTVSAGITVDYWGNGYYKDIPMITPSDPEDTWIFVSVTNNLPSDASNIFVRLIRYSNNAGGTVFFDDVDIHVINTPQPTIPASTFTNSVNFNFANNTFDFCFAGTGGTVRYEYRPASSCDGATFHAIKCVMNDSYTFWPSYYGGITIIDGGTEYPAWDPGINYTLLSITNNSDILKAYFKMQHGSVSQIILYKMRISGRTLIIETQSDASVSGGISFDRSEGTTNGRAIYVPYLMQMNILYAQDTFVSMFCDWDKTHASEINSFDSIFSTSSVFYSQYTKYWPLTDGKRRRINETIYLTSSPILDNVLPHIPNPVSPFKSSSAKRVIYDIWSPSFWLSRCHIQDAINSGITNVWVIIHCWQNGQYDNMLPDTMPACAAYGGPAYFELLSQTTRNGDYLFAVHENYVDYYTNAPSWNTDYVALNSDGTLKEGWFNSFFGIQSYQVKPSHAAVFLNNFASQIATSYWPDASYLDVHSAASPSLKVDYDANVINAGMFSETLKLYRALPGMLREHYNGPVSGEGQSHFYYIGYYDDLEAQIYTAKHSAPNNGQWMPLLVDFQLREIHDKMCCHGVGYVNRFFCNENGSMPPLDTAWTVEQKKEYIATEMAYGHAGFCPGISSNSTFTPLWNLELETRCMFPAQGAYAHASVVSILYNDHGEEISASEYIKRHPLTFDDYNHSNFMSQVKVVYDNDVVVCVNRHPTDSWLADIGRSVGFVDCHIIENGTNFLWIGQSMSQTYLLPPGNGWVVLTDPVPEPFLFVIFYLGLWIIYSRRSLEPGSSLSL